MTSMAWESRRAAARFESPRGHHDRRAGALGAGAKQADILWLRHAQAEQWTQRPIVGRTTAWTTTSHTARARCETRVTLGVSWSELIDAEASARGTEPAASAWRKKNPLTQENGSVYGTILFKTVRL